jgi:membrane-associated protease RseP (regulator of RpoE activity)
MFVLAAIAVLVILVIVHELGHFLAARLQGIHANRFSIGFGPVIWKYQGPETEYAVRGFLLGGYVGFPDDDPDSEIPADDPNLLRNRPVLDRAIVISAGVIANLVFAYLLLTIQLGVVGVPTGFSHEPGVLVPHVISKDSPAAQANIKSGDIIVAVNQQDLGASEQATLVVKTAIESSPGQPVELTVQRRDQMLTLKVTPKPDAEGKGRIGVELSPNGKRLYQHPPSILKTFSLAADEFEKIIVLTVQGFGQLISNFNETSQQVAGPVKIVEIGSNLARSDATSLFQFAALISINLAILNSLPLPALDGGQLFFLIVEAVRGKPLPTRLQDGIMQTGLVFLLGLGTFLILRDTAQLFQQ